jgi:hypothetical protein
MIPMMYFLRKSESEPSTWSSKVFWMFLLLGPVVTMLPYGWFVWNSISGYHSEGGAYMGIFLIFMAIPVLGLSAVLMSIAGTIFLFWTKKSLKTSDGEMSRMPFLLITFGLRGAATGFASGCVALPFAGQYGLMIALGITFSSAVCGVLCSFLKKPSVIKKSLELSA